MQRSGDAVALENKCAVVQNLTTSLSREMFEDPKQDPIYRQRRQVSRMVDLTLREPMALRGLTSLTHHDY